MSQIFLLIGVILLYFLYTIVKRSKISLLNLKRKDNQKKPEDYVTMLYRETVKFGFLKSRPLFLLDDRIKNEPDAETYSHRIVEDIMSYLEIPFSSIKINYSAKNEPPRVEMNDIHGFDFYIPADLKHSKGAIQSQLVFECSRIFMAFQRGEFSLKVKNQRLYDYVTIFTGLGVVFLQDLEDLIDLLRHIEPEFSYYTNVNDLLFLMAVYLHQRNLELNVLEGQLNSYQLRKIGRAYLELTKMPYRLLHKDAFDANIICQKCFQILRVPAGKKLQVTCNTCATQFEAKT